MRATLFVISVIGCYACLSGFILETRKGALCPSLFLAAVAWLIFALGALFAWRD